MIWKINTEGVKNRNKNFLVLGEGPSEVGYVQREQKEINAANIKKEDIKFYLNLITLIHIFVRRFIILQQKLYGKMFLYQI